MRVLAFLIAFQLSTLTAAADDKPLPPGAVRIGTPLYRLKEGWDRKAFLTTDGGTLISAAPEKELQFWDTATGKKMHKLSFGEVQFLGSAFAPKKNRLALVGRYRPSNLSSKTQYVLWSVDTGARQIEWTVNYDTGQAELSEHLRISPDGRRIFGTRDATLLVRDGDTGEALAQRTHKGVGMDVFEVSPDGKSIVYGASSLYCWKWETDEEPFKLASYQSTTRQIAFAADGQSLSVALDDGLVSRLAFPEGRVLETWRAGGSISNWSMSPDGKTLATVYRESSGRTESQFLILCNSVGGQEKFRIPLDMGESKFVTWSDDGARIAAMDDHRFRVWDVRNRKPVSSEPPGHDASIMALAFAGDGRLFTAAYDHTIRSWDSAGRPGLKLTQNSQVWCMALSPDSTLAAGSAGRNDLRIWDAATGAEKFKLLGNGYGGYISRIRFTQDSQRLVAWGRDLYLRAWDMKNGKLVSEHRVLPDGVKESDLNDIMRSMMIFDRPDQAACEICPDGATLAMTDGFHLKFIDVASGKERMRFQPSSEFVPGIAYSPDGSRLAIAIRGPADFMKLPNGAKKRIESDICEVGVWDLATQKPLWKGTAPAVFRARMAFNADGSRLALSVQGPKVEPAVHLWDAGNGAKLGYIHLPETGTALAFDRSGHRIAVAIWDTTAVVFDIQTALKSEPSEK